MHSWRVLLLPYLDEKDLHRAYRFDEPWNGPNNSKLADDMRAVYCCLSFPATSAEQKTMSNYLCITGAETAFPGAASVRFTDVTDGLSNTVFVTELYQHSVQWMRPEDIPVESAHGYLKSGDHTHVGGANCLIGNGTVMFVNENIPLPNFERLLTIADGIPVGEF